MVNPFVGTWKLISQHTHFADGSTLPSRGSNPAGILMYDAGGNMSVQLMRTDATAGDYTDLSQRITAMDGFLAYFGTYTIDADAKTVTHHVIGASYAAYRGSDQVRSYKIDGETLTLKASTGDTLRVLMWQKADSGRGSA